MAPFHANWRDSVKSTVVVVQRGLSRNWQVTPVGWPRSQSFADLDLAVGYAQLWAATHRPSTVRVLADGGEVEDEWSFA